MGRRRCGSWRKFRKRYIEMRKEENTFICDYCSCDLIEGKDPPVHNSVTLDHKIPLGSGGGLKDWNNFALACLSCNNIKGDKERA